MKFLSAPINTAIISPAGGNVGIGFAIPVNMAMASVEQVLEQQCMLNILGKGSSNSLFILCQKSNIKRGKYFHYNRTFLYKSSWKILKTQSILDFYHYGN